MVNEQIFDKSNADNTEQMILKYASEIFTEKGYEGARMQEIADRAGINKSLLHYYYRSKEKLFTAVFSVVFTNMMKGLISVFESDLSVFDSIREFFRRHQEILKKNKSLPIFMLNEVHRDPQLIINLSDQDKLAIVREKFFTKILVEQEQNIIRKSVEPMDLFINILSLSVFPFAARPLIIGFFKLDENSFNDTVEYRKESLGEFVINSIKTK